MALGPLYIHEEGAGTRGGGGGVYRKLKQGDTQLEQGETTRFGRHLFNDLSLFLIHSGVHEISKCLAQVIKTLVSYLSLDFNDIAH